MAARNSEIRSFLLRYAQKRGLLIQEYLSDFADGPIVWYCHIQDGKDPRHSATAVSREGFDNALVMAFLSYGNPEINFLD